MSSIKVGDRVSWLANRLPYDILGEVVKVCGKCDCSDNTDKDTPIVLIQVKWDHDGQITTHHSDNLTVLETDKV